MAGNSGAELRSLRGRRRHFAKEQIADVDRLGRIQKSEQNPDLWVFWPSGTSIVGRGSGARWATGWRISTMDLKDDPQATLVVRGP